MENFYEVCKVLINTETAYKDGTPHAIVTGIDSCTQKKAASVEFDYQKVFAREDTYHDIAGFYHTHPSGMSQMSATDVETMKQWVSCLGKSLICLIETDETINGWIFVKTDEGVAHQTLMVHTANNVNYNIWLEADDKFWNSSDFLINGAYLDDDDPEEDLDVFTNIFTDISMTLQDVRNTQSDMIDSFDNMVEVMKSLIETIKNET